MKTHNKKRGFTIVELVIVIAVIAILSAVMVPTFSGVVRKAKESAAMQEANNIARAVSATTEEGMFTNVSGVDAYIVTDEYWFAVDANKIGNANETKKTALPDTVKVGLTDLATLTEAGTYYVPVQLLDEFELSEAEQNYQVYVAYVK